MNIKSTYIFFVDFIKLKYHWTWIVVINIVTNISKVNTGIDWHAYIFFFLDGRHVFFHPFFWFVVVLGENSLFSILALINKLSLFNCYLFWLVDCLTSLTDVLSRCPFTFSGRNRRHQPRQIPKGTKRFGRCRRTCRLSWRLSFQVEGQEQELCLHVPYQCFPWSK